MSESKFIGLLQFFNFVFKKFPPWSRKHDTLKKYFFFLPKACIASLLLYWGKDRNSVDEDKKNGISSKIILFTGAKIVLFVFILLRPGTTWVFLFLSGHRRGLPLLSKNVSVIKCLLNLHECGWDSLKKDGWGIHMRGQFSRVDL